MSCFVDGCVTAVTGGGGGGNLLAMNANQHTPHPTRSPEGQSPLGHGVVTERQLRDRGVTAAGIVERCRPGGPWQELLPRVYLELSC